MSQADSLRHIADLYDELEKEKDEMRARWESACGTVAAMHAAAVGEVCGPRRGVVEDISDLRAEVERLTRERDEARDGLRAVMQADAEEANDYLDLGARFAASQADNDRIRAAAQLVLRWEHQATPHGGMASDMAFLRSVLSAQPAATGEDK